jgi:hypothetical protein
MKISAPDITKKAKTYITADPKDIHDHGKRCKEIYHEFVISCITPLRWHTPGVSLKS